MNINPKKSTALNSHQSKIDSITVLGDRNVDQGKEKDTVSRVATVMQDIADEGSIYNVVDDAIRYMMKNCMDISTCAVFQKTCKLYYNMLKEKVLEKTVLEEIEDFKNTYPIDSRLQWPLAILYRVAYKNTATPTPMELMNTVNVSAFTHLSPKQVVDQLPDFQYRYQRLQSILGELIKGLTVFIPSLYWFLDLPTVVIGVLKNTPYILLGFIVRSIMEEIWSPYCPKFNSKYELMPCTYLETAEYLITLYYRYFIISWQSSLGAFIMSSVKSSLFTLICFICVLSIPGQITQYRTAATVILDAIAKDLGF